MTAFYWGVRARDCQRSLQCLSFSPVDLQSSHRYQSKLSFLVPNSRWLHSLSTSTWFLAAAQATGINTALDCITDNEHQHGSRWQHVSRTSAGFQKVAQTTDSHRTLVVTRTKDINMASGNSTDHRHQDDLH